MRMRDLLERRLSSLNSPLLYQAYVVKSTLSYKPVIVTADKKQIVKTYLNE